MGQVVELHSPTCPLHSPLGHSTGEERGQPLKAGQEGRHTPSGHSTEGAAHTTAVGGQASVLAAQLPSSQRTGVWSRKLHSRGSGHWEKEGAAAAVRTQRGGCARAGQGPCRVAAHPHVHGGGGEPEQGAAHGCGHTGAVPTQEGG